jgi:hypothetical protein
MPAWGVSPIRPQDLLLLLEKQLQDGGTPTGSNLPGAGLGDLAFLSTWPDELMMMNPRGKQFVAIRPSRFPVWQSVVMGAGSVLQGASQIPTSTGFNAVVSLVSFVQINADPEMKSRQEVAEETLGVISFVLRVLKAVQFWTPCTDDTLGSCYLREYARVTDGGFGVTPKKVGTGYWNVCPFDLEMKFTSAF